MPLTLHPVFKPPLLMPEFAGQGEVLLAEIEALDDLADQHGLMRLSAFADTRSSPVNLEVSAENARLLPPWEDWFECGQGRIVCEKLARLAASGSRGKSSFKSPHQGVAIAMLALARILAAVEGADVQFRLEILWAESARAVVSTGKSSVGPSSSIRPLC